MTAQGFELTIGDFKSARQFPDQVAVYNRPTDVHPTDTSEKEYRRFLDDFEGFHGLGEEQKHKTEFSFDADHPEILASVDLGARPIEFVLVGLASCLTAGVAAVAQNRGVQLRSVEARLEGSMDIQGILGIDSDVRNGYDDIKVTFNIDADASKKDIEALVAQSQKRSAVYDLVTNPTNVTVEVV